MILKGLLVSSLGIIKHSVDGWTSDKIQKIIGSCLEQSQRIHIPVQDYSILNDKISTNQQEITSVLGRPFVRTAYDHMPAIAESINYHLLTQKTASVFGKESKPLKQIRLMPNGIMAANTVKLLFKNKGNFCTYDNLARAAGISYEYANDLANKLHGYVVAISKGGVPHYIQIYSNLDESAFYNRALDALRA